MIDIDTLNFIYPFQTETISQRVIRLNAEKKKEISRTQYGMASSRIWTLRVKTFNV